MSDAIQAQVEDLKRRVGDLEARENKLRIQSVGPRGPIGPAGHLGQQGEKGEKGDSVKGPAGKDGRDGRDGETPTKETIESMVVQLLTEYHVLDPETCLPYAGPYKQS